MTVQYDRKRCETWLERARGLLDDKELAQLWMDLAYDDEHTLFNVRGDSTLVMEWASMSLWERQAVFYMFMPVLKKLAATVAHAVCTEARKKEPL